PTEWGSASTSFIAPGGILSSGPASRSGKVEALPLVRQGSALRAVERDLEHAEAKDRALEPDRRQLDPDLLEQLLLGQPRHVRSLPALDEIGQHRRRRLRDRAAAALEAHVVDRLTVGGEAHGDRDLVAAERVLAFRVRVRLLERPVVPRVLVVVEDHLAVHVLEVAQAWISITRRTPAARRSTSSAVL